MAASWNRSSALSATIAGFDAVDEFSDPQIGFASVGGTTVSRGRFTTDCSPIANSPHAFMAFSANFSAVSPVTSNLIILSLPSLYQSVAAAADILRLKPRLL
jgi:hypothetical protein